MKILGIHQNIQKKIGKLWQELSSKSFLYLPKNRSIKIHTIEVFN